MVEVTEARSLRKAPSRETPVVREAAEEPPAEEAAAPKKPSKLKVGAARRAARQININDVYLDDYYILKC